MTGDQVGGIIRTLGAALGGYFVGLGWVTAADMSTIVGAIAVIGVAVWSHYTNRPEALAPKK